MFKALLPNVFFSSFKIGSVKNLCDSLITERGGGNVQIKWTPARLNDGALQEPTCLSSLFSSFIFPTRVITETERLTLSKGPQILSKLTRRAVMLPSVRTDALRPDNWRG